MSSTSRVIVAGIISVTVATTVILHPEAVCLHCSAGGLQRQGGVSEGPYEQAAQDNMMSSTDSVVIAGI